MRCFTEMPELYINYVSPAVLTFYLMHRENALVQKHPQSRNKIASFVNVSNLLRIDAVATLDNAVEALDDGVCDFKVTYFATWSFWGSCRGWSGGSARPLSNPIPFSNSSPFVSQDHLLSKSLMVEPSHEILKKNIYFRIHVPFRIHLPFSNPSH